MHDFWFHIPEGFYHVLDINGPDHVLFLAALAIPFTFKSWKQVMILATIFTIAHCTSLAFSAYDILSINATLTEFLIPVTIALTAILNLSRIFKKEHVTGIYFQILATAFFGLIHGFGFSNYFDIYLSDSGNILPILLGFATGIEFSQIVIILAVLLLSYLVQSVLKVKQSIFIGVTSVLILIIIIPMLISTFPN